MELKIQCPHGRAGSTPAAGIVNLRKDKVFKPCLFFYVLYSALSSYQKIPFSKKYHPICSPVSFVY